MKLVVRWLLNAAALWVADAALSGVAVRTLTALLIAALAIGLINALIRPVLLVLTIPITVLTLGLFLIVLNGLLFWLAAELVPGFMVAGFVWAVLGALIMSVVGFALSFLVR
ncbi:MAG: phage holin family protein [Gemmatimonadetes bacterium]|nr:phage holin family protein [Gemmatimonadota bacterium]